MKKILFYISGHGYGHTTRCIEVIKKIQLMRSNCEIHIQTNAPPWFFTLNLQHNYKLIQKVCDIGAIQNNSYDVDQKATLEAFARFYQTFGQRIKREVNYIKQNQMELVVGDIPPLAFLAADQANIPSIAITNFSWNWIYQPYAERYPEYQWVIDEIKKSYQKTHLLLRLPFHGDLHAFPNKIDIPMIARKAWMTKEEVKNKLGIHQDQNIILVALRREDIEQIHFEKVSKISNYTFLFFTPVPQYTNILSVKADILPYQNLVSASKMVISKPGYGIVSECWANQTPLLYTPRKNFCEYEILNKTLKDHGTGLLMSRDDFLNGNWDSYMNKMLKKPIRWPDWPINGAEVAAEKIIGF